MQHHISLLAALFILCTYSLPVPALAQSPANCSKAPATKAVATAGKPAAKNAVAMAGKPAATKALAMTGKPAPTTTTNGHHWSTRRKIIVAVLAGCIIATAIAVPVGVSAHHQHMHREACKRALASLIFQNSQDAAHIQRINNLINSDLQQERGIQQQLNQSNLTQAQLAQLQTNLKDLQREVGFAQQSESLISSASRFNPQIRENLTQSFVAADSPATAAFQNHQFGAAALSSNRASLAVLMETNTFGQNNPAIAATESQYQEMWAQDAAAMLGYHGGSSGQP